MSKDASVRVGVVGLGNMGRSHAKRLLGGEVPGAVLAAVADNREEAMAAFPEVAAFADADAMIASGAVDAVVIATPHYSHTTIGAASLRAGLHTLVEKPISVHKADCETLIAAHTDPSVIFAAMFNQRTDPAFRKIRALVRSGELGEIRRIQWTITDWFRTEAYYRSGGWRATWAGEGGGVLLNQCPHNLDLWQWIFGMPASVWADCRIGRYHDIEVEDDVTAVLRYSDGTTGTFIASTGEAPGTNRLEVAAERGRLVFEGGILSFKRNEVPMSEFSRTTDEGFGKPDLWEVGIPLNPTDRGPQHLGILRNFVAAIQGREELIAPAEEGIHSVELGNAMLLSSENGAPVDLPVESAVFADLLKKKIESSRFVKKVDERTTAEEDFAKSF